MTPYVAFLRAINVGGRTVKMDRLRDLFGEEGVDGVDTYIQSGNVFFRSDEPAGALTERLEGALARALGYEVPVFLRTIPELAAIVGRRPFGQTKATDKEYISFLPAEPPPERRAAMAALSDPIDDFQVIGRELHWLSRRDVGLSKITNATVERVLGMPATRRNVTTVGKVMGRWGDTGRQRDG